MVIVGLVCLCSLAGCGQKDYKEDADERVYNIIDKKWQDDFGSKANYKISDTPPSSNDIQIEKAIPASGVLTISQAVALATAHNRQYQTQKETLYIMALDLRLFQHDFESQFFSGARQGYGKEGNDEGIGGEADVGFGRLLADGTRIGAKVGLAWFSVLTGNPEGGMASILTATITKPLQNWDSKSC